MTRKELLRKFHWGSNLWCASLQASSGGGFMSKEEEEEEEEEEEAADRARVSLPISV